MSLLQYDLLGEARTKKNSQQIIKVKGRSIIIPSAAYKKYEAQCGQYLLDKPPTPINTPCEVTCLYFLPRTKTGDIPKRKPDLANLLEATQDILVHYKILEDDNASIVFSLDGSRVYWTTGQPHTLVEIRRLDGQTESGDRGDST